jgi:hypothetical protein
VALQASALRWLAQLQHDGKIDRHVVLRLKVRPAALLSAPALALS